MGASKSREHNVMAPHGQQRPFPSFVANDMWTYRGRQILLTEGGSGWWSETRVVDPKVRSRIGRSQLSDEEIFQPIAAPDARTALRYATWVVDVQERLLERGGVIFRGEDDPYAASYLLWWAMEAVLSSMQKLRVDGKQVTRANVARDLERELARVRPKRGGLRPMPRTRKTEHAEAFMMLPVGERVELIDEMISLAAAFGGRYPNPGPPLLALRSTTSRHGAPAVAVVHFPTRTTLWVTPDEESARETIKVLQARVPYAALRTEDPHVVARAIRQGIPIQQLVAWTRALEDHGRRHVKRRGPESSAKRERSRRGNPKRNPKGLTPWEILVLTRLRNQAEESMDDWGIAANIDEYLATPEEDDLGEFMSNLQRDVWWNYGHVGDDEEDKASATRAEARVAEAHDFIDVGPHLAKINRNRRRLGQDLLDPMTMGWTWEDVVAEARRLETNPDERYAQLMAWAPCPN